MLQADATVSPQFTQPVKQIIWMLSVAVLTSIGVYFLYPAVAPDFPVVALFERIYSAGVFSGPVVIALADDNSGKVGQLDRRLCT